MVREGVRRKERSCRERVQQSGKGREGEKGKEEMVVVGEQRWKVSRRFLRGWDCGEGTHTWRQNRRRDVGGGTRARAHPPLTDGRLTVHDHHIHPSSWQYHSRLKVFLDLP